MTYRRPMFGAKIWSFFPRNERSLGARWLSSVVSKAGTVYYTVQDGRNFGVQ